MSGPSLAPWEDELARIKRELGLGSDTTNYCYTYYYTVYYLTQ